MRQARAIWLIIKVREAGIRLNKESKTYDNAINLTYIQGSPGEKVSIKFKRSMKLLLKVMEVLYKGLPHPKGEMSAWALIVIQGLARIPMCGKALPFTTCHF